MITFMMYIGFFVLLGITSYYTVLYTQLNESINALSDKIDTHCGNNSVVETYKTKNKKKSKKK